MRSKSRISLLCALLLLVSIECATAVTTPGTCGNAVNTPTSAAPSANLCGLNSTPTAVSGYGPWTWICNSTNGGVPSPTCTAQLATQQVYVQLLRTGQNTCYMYDTSTGYSKGVPIPCPATGQDGELQKGAAWPATRFTDNTDGTITDNLTGLVWLQKVDCFIPQTWSSALTAAKNIADGACGLSDKSIPGTWRLPNINELNSLTDLQQSAPTFPVNAPGVPMGSPFTGLLYNYQYWSSTSSADGVFAWIVSFQSGSLSTSNKTSPQPRVWLVKGDSIRLLKTGQTLCYDPANNSQTSCTDTGQDGESQAGVAWSNGRFVNNQAEGTITDTVTGLVWLKNANCTDTVNNIVKSGTNAGMLGFDNSLAWSNGLASGQCGLNDGSSVGQWRIPNRNELLSLVNYAEARNNTNSNATWLTGLGFTDVQTGNFYRTSDTSLLTTTQAWRVDLREGTSSYRDKQLVDWVLPVRDGNFLSVNIAGTGSGTVNSTLKPVQSTAIACPGTCRGQYSPGSVIELSPTGNWYSSFLGWIGCDSVSINNVCSLTMDQSRVATAVFDEILTIGGYNNTPPAPSPIGYASRIQKVYDYLATISLQNATIFTTVANYFENLLFSSPTNVYIKGGWEGPGPTGAGWANPNYIGVSTVHGSLRISNGKLTASNLKIQ